MARASGVAAERGFLSREPSITTGWSLGPERPGAPPPQGSVPPYQPPAGAPPYPGMPYPPPLGAPPYPVMPYGRAPYPGPPRRRLSPGAIAAIVVGIVVVLGVGMAAAIPVFLRQRELEQATVLSRFDGLVCAQLAAAAVRFSSDIEYPGDPLLEGVTGLSRLEDHREGLRVPPPGEVALIMTCSGRGRWADGSVAPIVLELTLDSGGEAWIYYVPQ